VVRSGAYNPAVDVVRYSTVCDLYDAGFEVRRAATVAIPDHVLVSYDGDWDDVVAERFDACFGPTLATEQ
jgi:hypothetical protein